MTPDAAVVVYVLHWSNRWVDSTPLGIFADAAGAQAAALTDLRSRAVPTIGSYVAHAEDIAETRWSTDGAGDSQLECRPPDGLRANGVRHDWGRSGHTVTAVTVGEAKADGW